MPDLEIATAEATQVFSEGDVVTIGRRDDNLVILTDPSVSRQHAVIRFGGGAWVLEDLSNGRTFHNGQAVGTLTFSPSGETVSFATPTGPSITVTVLSPVVTMTVADGLEPGSPSADAALAGVGEGSAVASAAAAQAQAQAQAQAEAEQAAAERAAAAQAQQAAAERAAAAQAQQAAAERAAAAQAQQAAAAQASAAQAAQAQIGQPAYGQPGPVPGGQPSMAFRPGAQAPGYGAPPAAGYAPAGRGGRPGSLDSSQIKRALNILLPYRSWVQNADWRQGVRLLFLIYAMLPVVFDVVFSNTTNFQTLGWVYALYTAPIWLLVFWYLIKPTDSIRTLLITGAVVSALVLLVMAGPLQWWYRTVPAPQKTPGDWFSWLIAPGFAEELTKDGSVLLVLLAARMYFKDKLSVRGCMLLGTVAGLAFGAREAALYQSNDANLFGQVSGQHALVQYVLLFSLRIFTDGLQHAEWAGIACFFMGLGLTYTRRGVPLILFGFAFGAVIHATNDWSTGESKWLWLVLQVLWAALFLGYTLFAPNIEAQVRETSLFRGESIIAERLARDDYGGQPGPGAGAT